MLELRLSRETIASQAERLGYVTAERDAVRAELAAARAPGSMLEGSGATPSVEAAPEPFWSRWPRGWIAGAATLLAIVAAVVLLVVSR